MAEMKGDCELCDGKATTYCPSDNAFLCTKCDEKVHCANFLVARHVRCYMCSECRNFENSFQFSGTRVPHAGITCKSCSPHVVVTHDEGVDEGDTLSSSSSCVSSTGEVGAVSASSTSSKKGSGAHRHCVSVGGKMRGVVAVDEKVEGVLVNWCRKMGVEDRRVVTMAVELVSVCMKRMTVLPFRVLLAGAFWVSVRLYCDDVRFRSTSTCHELRNLEQISGVPAKLITATESRLARVIKRRPSREDHEEGWAEC